MSRNAPLYNIANLRPRSKILSPIPLRSSSNRGEIQNNDAFHMKRLFRVVFDSDMKVTEYKSRFS